MDEGGELAGRARHNVMKRDSASGEGIEVVKITAEGYKIVDENEIKRVRNALT